MKYDIEQDFSSQTLDQLARQTGFIQRQRKLSASHLLNMLMFSVCNQSHRSLEDMTADLYQQFGVDLSKEALHKRFTHQGVLFLQELINLHLSNQLSSLSAPESQTHFPSIKIKDSCRFSLPDTYEDAYPGFGNFSEENGLMQIQYAYDLVNGRGEVVMLTNIRRNDQKASNETVDLIKAGELYIRDLGYITPTYLKAVIEETACFLNRLPSQVNIYTYEKGQLDWKTIDRRFTKSNLQTLELNVLIYKEHQIPCRLVIERVDDQEYEKRLKKAHQSAKSRGVGISDEHKIRCRYNAFITNVDKDILPVGIIRKIYYLRWQIELVFKTWKSFFEIHRVKKVKKERLEAQLLAQLLWILLNWKFFNACNHYIQKEIPGRGVSVLKFFKRCLSFSQTLRVVVIQPELINQWLENVFLPAVYNTACEPPWKKKTHYQIIYEFNKSLS